MLKTTLLAAALLAISASALAAEMKSPAQAYANRETNLAELPPGEVETRPLRLHVQFSLNAAPGTPEAKAFLEENMRVVRSMPQPTGATLSRLVTPATHDYMVTVDFPNWAAYRAYDTDPAFLDFYYKSWRTKVKRPHLEFLTLMGAEGTK